MSSSPEDKSIISILLFFFLTYVITWGWAFMIMYLLSDIYYLQSYDSFIGVLCTIFVGIQAFGPSIAAVITIAFYEGKTGLRKFALRLVNFKVKYYWYLLVFFMPIIVYSIPILISLIAGNPLNINYFDISSWNISIPIVITNIIFAGIAEEPGYRGFAVPTLNKKFKPIVSGIIIGVIWAFWHLLHYIYGGRPWETFPQFVFTVTVISCIYVWVYKKTESIPIMIIFHVMHNLSNGIYIAFHKPIWGGLIYLGILIIIIIFDTPTLLKKPEDILHKVNKIDSESNTETTE